MKTLTNAYIKKDGEGSYWLRVESSAGMASINLSAEEDELICRVLEQWAKEQLEEAPLEASGDDKSVM
jgi:hypothetical protein